MKDELGLIQRLSKLIDFEYIRLSKIGVYFFCHKIRYIVLDYS